MKTPMTKLMLAAVATTMLCLGAQAATGDLLAHLSFDDYGNDGTNVLKATVGEDGIVRTTKANVVEGLGAVTPVTDAAILAGLPEGDGAVAIPVNTHIALPIPAALASESGKPWSISMKVKFPSFGKYYSIFTMPAANSSDMMVFLRYSSSPVIALKQSGSGVNGSGGFTAGQWETLLFLFDSDNTRVLLNGKQIFSKSYTLSGSRADCANAGGYILLSGDEDGEGPAKPATATACYLFNGWAEEVVPVTSNATYTATYKLVSGQRVVDISTLNGEYIAQDGDILIGTLIRQVPIRLNQSGMTVTLAGMYLADSIYAYADDVTILIADDTTNTIRPYYEWPGINPSSTNPAHVLTIKSESANTGVLDVQGGAGCAAIGPSRNEICGGVVMEGGTIIATGSSGYPGIGASENSTCGDIAIHGTIAKVVATGTPPIDNGEGAITIAQTLLRTYSNNNKTLTLEHSELLYDITWVDDNGADTTVVAPGVVPIHSPMTKSAAAPYRWVFTGWTPELEAAVSNTTYTATFKKIADLSLVESDWTAADGDD